MIGAINLARRRLKVKNDHDAIAEPATPAPPAAPPRPYQLTTKQGTTPFQTVEEWLAAWAKLVRGCKAAKALDKLQTARETNKAHVDAVAASDPEVSCHAHRATRSCAVVARQDV
jgi:hypothetical protein